VSSGFNALMTVTSRHAAVISVLAKPRLRQLGAGRGLGAKLDVG